MSYRSRQYRLLVGRIRTLRLVRILSLYLQFFRHAPVERRLRLSAAREVLIVVVQTRPVIGELLVAAAFDFPEEVECALGHLLPFAKTFARVFVFDAALHERLVLLGAVCAVVMRGSHQHGRRHLQLVHVQLLVRNGRRHLQLGSGKVKGEPSACCGDDPLPILVFWSTYWSLHTDL